MKIYTPFLLACALAMPAFAQAPAPKAAATPATAKDTSGGVLLDVAKAVVTAPLALKDGALGQSEKTELPEGGKATFTFSVPVAGDYVIHAMVDAPDEDSNSFYLNIDADPKDPDTIWDMAVTKGFEERIVSWRGSGTDSSDEFAPKVFKLTAGEHKLIVFGREPAKLKSLTVRPVKK
jgi:hypothetical protein